MFRAPGRRFPCDQSASKQEWLEREHKENLSVAPPISDHIKDEIRKLRAQNLPVSPRQISKRLRKIKTLQISLSAITTGGIFAVLFSEESTVAATIAAITATIQFFLNTFTKENSLSELAKRHADTASKL